MLQLYYIQKINMSSNSEQNNSWDILSLAKSLTQWWWGRIFIGLSLLLLANQTFGDPFGKYMDQKFKIASQEQTNTYNLQLKTIELIEEKFNELDNDMRDVKDELDDLNEAYRDHEERLDALEEWHK